MSSSRSTELLETESTSMSSVSPTTSTEISGFSEQGDITSTPATNITEDPDLLDLNDAESFVDISMNDTSSDVSASNEEDGISTETTLYSETDASTSPSTSLTPSTLPPTPSTTSEVVEVLEEATSQQSDVGVVEDNASSIAGTPEPLVTVPIPSEKELEWTIVSNTTKVIPTPLSDNTTKAPVMVRYFVKVTRGPWVNSKRRTSLVNAQLETTTTTAPEISLSVEASTSEAERLPVPDIDPITTKAVEEGEDVADDQFLAELIPTMKFFRLTTPSPALAETSSLPPQSTSASVTAASPTESNVATSVTTALPTESTSVTSDHEATTTEEQLYVQTMKFFLGPRLGAESSPTSPTAITSNPLEHPKTSPAVHGSSSTPTTIASDPFEHPSASGTVPMSSVTSFGGSFMQEESKTTAMTAATSENSPPQQNPPETLENNSSKSVELEQEVTESQESPFSSEVDDDEESATTPPTSESNDILAQPFETQTARGVVVSSAVPRLTSLSEARPLSNRGHLLPSSRILVPVIPSFVPMRLRELPETPQSIQDDITHEPKTRRPEAPLGFQEESAASQVVQPPQLGSLKVSLSSLRSSSAPQSIQEDSPKVVKHPHRVVPDVPQRLPAAPKSIQDVLASHSHFSFRGQTRGLSMPSQQPHSAPRPIQKVLNSAELAELPDRPVRMPHGQPPAAIPPTSEIPPEERYTMIKVQTLKPFRATKKPKLMPPPAQLNPVPAGDLWWTPRPSFLGKTMEVTVTKPPKTGKKRGFRKRIKTSKSSVSGAHRFPLVMEEGANVNGLSATPLATAAAVGQLSYTTTIPIEMKYTTRRPFHMKEVGPRKTALLLVPETHLKKLQSELEIFDSIAPVATAPVQPLSPVDLSIFGNPKKIIHRKKSRKVLRKIMKYPIGKFGGRLIRNKKRKNRKWASFRIPTASEKPHSHKDGHSLKKVYGETVRGSSQQKSIEDEVDMIISPPKRKRQHHQQATPLPISPAVPAVPSKSLDLVLAKDRLTTVEASKPELKPKEMMSADMDELEQALREIAQSSKEQNFGKLGPISSSEGLGDQVHSIDGETALPIAQKRTRSKTVKKGKTKTGTFRGKGLKSINTTFKFIPPPPPLDADLMRTPGMQSSAMEKFYDTIKHDNSRLPASKQLCVKFECNFEKDDLCGFDPSLMSRKERRSKREFADPAYFTMKRWTNWVGSYHDNNQRVDRAPAFSLSNRRFAGALLSGQQMATISLKVITMEPFTISFDAWEATRELQMRVCCDDSCPLATDFGGRIGDRSWRRLTMECPGNTHLVTFECMNFGNRRGACGIDNFSLHSQSCTQRPASIN
ncbi:hypothetical protein Y032_0128g1422 [Ancylostoma ceylanicum]|uniref:Uncharacterized protein n=2 Tax=Ancylostoma ceylanicum TaxID=53326 RepID=A0A016T7N6_9BILA|nr:hypothetical protein Y032_0128g1422 [Ancylostoma ceylanicum]